MLQMPWNSTQMHNFPPFPSCDCRVGCVQCSSTCSPTCASGGRTSSGPCCRVGGEVVAAATTEVFVAAAPAPPSTDVMPHHRLPSPIATAPAAATVAVCRSLHLQHRGGGGGAGQRQRVWLGLRHHLGRPRALQVRQGGWQAGRQAGRQAGGRAGRLRPPQQGCCAGLARSLCCAGLASSLCSH